MNKSRLALKWLQFRRPERGLSQFDGPTLGLPTEIRLQIFQYRLQGSTPNQGWLADPWEMYLLLRDTRPNPHVIFYQHTITDRSPRQWNKFPNFEKELLYSDNNCKPFFASINSQILSVCHLWLHEAAPLLYGSSDGFVASELAPFLFKFLPTIGKLNASFIRELTLYPGSELVERGRWWRLGPDVVRNFEDGGRITAKPFMELFCEFLCVGDCLPRLQTLRLTNWMDKSKEDWLSVQPYSKLRGAFMEAVKMALESRKFDKVAWSEQVICEPSSSELLGINATLYARGAPANLKNHEAFCFLLRDDKSFYSSMKNPDNPESKKQIPICMLDSHLIANMPLKRCREGIHSIDELTLTRKLVTPRRGPPPYNLSDIEFFQRNPFSKKAIRKSKGAFQFTCGALKPVDIYTASLYVNSMLEQTDEMWAND
ncbi:MAG: hypothetical protein Q9227_004541 [Pyrenula ochraceoflavens]